MPLRQQREVLLRSHGFVKVSGVLWRRGSVSQAPGIKQDSGLEVSAGKVMDPWLFQGYGLPYPGAIYGGSLQARLWTRFGCRDMDLIGKMRLSGGSLRVRLWTRGSGRDIDSGSDFCIQVEFCRGMDFCILTAF